MNDVILDQVPTMNIEELWDMFLVLHEEAKLTEYTFSKVKFGYKVRFDIRQYIRYLHNVATPISIRPRQEHVYIHQHIYHLKDFDDEIDKRKSIMRQTLIEHYSDVPDLTQSRVMERPIA